MLARETKEKDLFHRGVMGAFVRGYLPSGEMSSSFPENPMGGGGHAAEPWKAQRCRCVGIVKEKSPELPWTNKMGGWG